MIPGPADREVWCLAPWRNSWLQHFVEILEYGAHTKCTVAVLRYMYCTWELAQEILKGVYVTMSNLPNSTADCRVFHSLTVLLSYLTIRVKATVGYGSASTPEQYYYPT